jgi:hypothetical protein
MHGQENIKWLPALFINLSQKVWIWLEAYGEKEAKYPFLYVIASKKLFLFYWSLSFDHQTYEGPLVSYFVTCYQDFNNQNR